MKNNYNYLRVKDLTKKLNIGKSKLWSMIREGKFPKPIKLGARTSVWLEDTVDNWMVSNTNNDNKGDFHNDQ